jgi:hypothetical protein
MQNLFEFNAQTGLIQMNRDWIYMVPEFKEIAIRSKKCKGDHDGRKKLHAQRIFTFIYMLVDFRSPLRDMEGEIREKEALRCAELEKADVTDEVRTATGVYEWYQENSARSLRTLKALRRSLDQADNYFLQVDFGEKDKKGELVYSMKEYIQNMKGIDDAYNAFKAFEERVYRELEEKQTVRGERKLGGKEGKRTSWEEGRRPDTKSKEFKQMTDMLFVTPALTDTELSTSESTTDEESWDPDADN